MRINSVRDWILASMRRRLCSFLAVPNRYGFAGPLLATVALLTLFGGFLSSGSARADCIEDLVSQVSEARLRNHVEALEWEKAHILAGGMVIFSFVVILTTAMIERRAGRGRQ